MRRAHTSSRPDETQAILRHWREAVPDDRLAHLVKDTARAFVKSLQRRLVRHGLSFGHWTFLRILWERDGLTQAELSVEAGVMEPTTFAALKAMAARGYIERRQVLGNRKKVYVHLTSKGRRLKRLLVPEAEAVNSAAVRGMTAADLKITRVVLLAIIGNLAAEDAEHTGHQP